MACKDTNLGVNNFIVFEGIDGSGTTTQIKYLESVFSQRNISVNFTAEPTERPEGKLIRRILKGELDADPGTVTHLFASDRYQHLYGKGGIFEHLNRGEIVICDRYVLSSLAYQGISCGNDLPHYLNARFPPPGLTVFFRIEASKAMQRIQKRQELEIFEQLPFQQAVEAAYEAEIAVAIQSGWKIEILNAEESLENVSHRLVEIIDQHLSESAWHRRS